MLLSVLLVLKSASNLEMLPRHIEKLFQCCQQRERFAQHPKKKVLLTVFNRAEVGGEGRGGEGGGCI